MSFTVQLWTLQYQGFSGISSISAGAGSMLGRRRLRIIHVTAITTAATNIIASIALFILLK